MVEIAAARPRVSRVRAPARCVSRWAERFFQARARADLPPPAAAWLSSRARPVGSERRAGRRDRPGERITSSPGLSAPRVFGGAAISRGGGPSLRRQRRGRSGDYPAGVLQRSPRPASASSARAMRRRRCCGKAASVVDRGFAARSRVAIRTDASSSGARAAAALPTARTPSCWCGARGLFGQPRRRSPRVRRCRFQSRRVFGTLPSTRWRARGAFE